MDNQSENINRSQELQDNQRYESTNSRIGSNSTIQQNSSLQSSSVNLQNVNTDIRYLFNIFGYNKVINWVIIKFF